MIIFLIFLVFDELQMSGTFQSVFSIFRFWISGKDLPLRKDSMRGESGMWTKHESGLVC